MMLIPWLKNSMIMWGQLECELRLKDKQVRTALDLQIWPGVATSAVEGAPLVLEDNDLGATN